MRTYEVDVTQRIEVTVDETKMDETFFGEFRENFFPFFDIEDHVKHIAQLYARGVYQGDRDEFVEGYGKLREEFGVEITDIDQWEDVNWNKAND